MEPKSQRLLGVLLVVASAAVFSIAGVFTKMAAADAWTIVGWRGLVGSILLGLYCLWQRHRSAAPHPLWLDWRGWFIAFNSMLASGLFVLSLKYTYVTNVAVIFATAPFMAGALAWLVLGERLSWRAILTASVCLAGVLIIVSGGPAAASLTGDILALLMTAMFAIYIVATRAFRDTPILWAVAVASVLLFCFSWLIADPSAISQRDLMICVAFGFTFAAAFILLTEGAKLLPIAETALIGTLDIPFAVGFAWLFINEVPPLNSILGGSVVVAAIAVQSAVEVMRGQDPVGTDICPPAE